MHTYTVLNAPADEPVTLAEVKLAAHIDDTRFDTLLPAYIKAAREQAEHELGRDLMPRRLRLELCDWPDAISIVRSPVSAIEAVSYWTGATWATLDPSLWDAVVERFRATVAPAAGAAWPALGNLVGPRVRLDFTTGYAAIGANVATAQAAIPQGVKTWIALWCKCAIDERDLPAYAAGLLHAERAYL